jgi:hypothetical protein
MNDEAVIAPTPQTGSTQPTQGPSPDQARAELEQLRIDRVNGSVSQRDYLERADYLARVSGGDLNAERPKDRFEYQSAEVQEEILRDEAMQPGKPHQYQISGSMDERVETAMREAMAAAGIPAQYGGTLVGQVDRLLTRFSQAEPDDVSRHYQAVGEKLRQDWGDQYSVRVQAVNDLLADAAESHPLVANLLDRRPYAFSDPWVMQTLWMVAEHRQRRHKR